MSKIKLALLSFIASELFILLIELIFDIPLNISYYLNPTLTNTTDAMIPLLSASWGWAGSAANVRFVEKFLKIVLRFLTSPALLIAGAVYLLAPNEENVTGFEL